MKEAKSKEKQMDDESRSVAAKTSSTGSEKQQKNAKDIGARLEIATVDNHTGEASPIPAAATTTLHISNSELAKMVKDAQVAMMMNTTPKNRQPQSPGSSKQQLLSRTQVVD
nr:uncharacterized protein LOC117276467 [Nicotiana tomentosiformis]